MAMGLHEIGRHGHLNNRR